MIRPGPKHGYDEGLEVSTLRVQDKLKVLPDPFDHLPSACPVVVQTLSRPKGLQRTTSHDLTLSPACCYNDDWLILEQPRSK
jgi:hypothetical protein